jgi:hypothetical protein
MDNLGRDKIESKIYHSIIKTIQKNGRCLSFNISNVIWNMTSDRLRESATDTREVVVTKLRQEGYNEIWDW